MVVLNALDVESVSVNGLPFHLLYKQLFVFEVGLHILWGSSHHVSQETNVMLNGVNPGGLSGTLFGKDRVH